jgi:hypothetical protein
LVEKRKHILRRGRRGYVSSNKPDSPSNKPYRRPVAFCGFSQASITVGKGHRATRVLASKYSILQRLGEPNGEALVQSLCDPNGVSMGVGADVAGFTIAMSVGDRR